jgi:hypothetical protein
MNGDSEIRRVLARIVATEVAKGFGSGRRAAGVRNESDAIFFIRTSASGHLRFFDQKRA